MDHPPSPTSTLAGLVSLIASPGEPADSPGYEECPRRPQKAGSAATRHRADTKRLWLETVRWPRLFGQVFRVLKWQNYSVSRRGGGNVKIGFMIFKVLWEGWKTVLPFSTLSIRPSFPRPDRLRVKPPELPADGGSIPGQAFALPGSNAGGWCCRTPDSGRSCFWPPPPTRRRAGRHARI